MSRLILRVSKDRFAPEKCTSEEVNRGIRQSAGACPARTAVLPCSGESGNLDGERQYLGGSEAAKQMDTLQAMLARRPILEAAGVTFDRIANYEPLWTLGSVPRSVAHSD